jgi:hypothetical protein
MNWAGHLGNRPGVVHLREAVHRPIAAERDQHLSVTGDVLLRCEDQKIGEGTA